MDSSSSRPMASKSPDVPSPVSAAPPGSAPAEGEDRAGNDTRILTAGDREWICEHAAEFRFDKSVVLADTAMAVLRYEATLRALESALRAATERAEAAERALREASEWGELREGDWKVIEAVCGMGCLHSKPRIIVTLPDGSQRDAEYDELVTLLRTRATVRRAARAALTREGE